LKFIGNISVKQYLNKTIIGNLLSLSVIQVLNLLTPFITYGYLVQVLGVKIYGLVVFQQAIAAYFALIVGFGFNISAVRDVSIYRNDITKLSEIVSSVLTIKFLLFILSILVLFIALWFIPEIKRNSHLLILSVLGVCLTDLLNPVWYFQGIEKMRYITYVNIVSKICLVGLVFTLIKSSDDFLLVPIINLITSIISGVITFYVIFFKNRVIYTLQSPLVLRTYFKDSAPFFFSNLSTGVYVMLNKVLVGVFLRIEDVSFYDLAEKLSNLLKVPQQLLSQTLFPQNSLKKNIKEILGFLRVSIIMNIILFFLLAVFNTQIVMIIGGVDMLEGRDILIVLGLTIPIVGLSNVLGIHLLVAFGFSKEFSKVIIFSAFIYLFLVTLVYVFFSVTLVNLGIVLVATEVLIVGFLLKIILKKKL
jgi:O-antigen/teichoic acid export membrane protein